jgi:hypothetical protein
MSLLGHIQSLAQTIGPRGSATEAEAKAADYIAEHLNALALVTERQPFLSATSAYSPYIVATGGVLLSLFLFWQPQPVGAAAAAVLTAIILISVLRQLSFQDNPLRWIIATGNSQNVLTTIPANDPVLPPIVITAHIDSHRTPLLFSTPTWRRFFHALMPIGLACIALLLGLFVAGIFNSVLLLRQIALLPGVVVAIMFVLFIQAARSLFTAGANDNASGVAVTLGLAERLRDQPLGKRDVVVAFTGCEEVGAYGIEALLATHALRWRHGIHLVIDHVGGQPNTDDGPCVVQSEKFFRRVNSDPHLLALATNVMTAQPELKAHKQDFDLAYSELTIGAKYGLRPLGIMGLTQQNTLPNWHVPSDIVTNINETTLEHAAAFAWHLLREIDRDDAIAGKTTGATA